MVLLNFAWLIYMLVFLEKSKSENNFFIVNKHDDAEYKCVTNSHFALSWIPDGNQTSEAVSISIPKLDNNFDNSINSDEETRSYYEKNVWHIESTSNHIILDRRWEEMEMFETNPTRQYHEFDPSTDKQLLDLAISLRATKEFEILMCDDKARTTSRCYCLMISSDECKIQKCKQVNFQQSKFRANETLKQEKHECNTKNILDNTWSHFKIRRERRKLLFIHMVQNQPSLLTEEIILEVTDQRDVIDVKKIILHSEKAPVFWKIHNLEYIRTGEKSITNLGRPIYPVNNSICISMFYSMCNMCTLTLILRTQNNETVEEKLFKTSNTEWREDIKFIINNLENDTPYYLYISTISQETDNIFWAIDSVRQCQQEEYRMISSNKKGKCQLMNAEKNTISSSNPSNEYNIANQCPKDTIGDFCVSCKWIYKDCEKIKICGKSGCSCSAGFKMSNERDCTLDCDPSHYGHNCQKQCQQCFGMLCNPIDGRCKKYCAKNYSGENCTIPPATRFSTPPNVTNINYTEATITVNFGEVQIYEKDDPSSSFAVDYKKINDQEWTHHSRGHDFSEKNSVTNVTIRELETDTRYLVRCVITTKKNQTYKDDGYVLNTNFTTKCQDLGPYSFYLKPSDTNVSIFFDEEKDFLCRYNVSVSNSTYWQSKRIRTNNYTFFEDLKPHSQYNITIESHFWRHTESFNTSGNIPERVRNLTIIDQSPTSVLLTWKRPITIYDFELKGYHVEYQRISYLSCNKSDPSEKMSSSDVTKIYKDIKGLTPYSKYTFSVYAINSKNINGYTQTLNHSTLASDKIEPDEIPKIENLVAQVTTAEVKFSKIDCEQIRGPLNATATLICTTEWCRNDNKTIFEKITNNSLSLKNLTAFTDYTLKLKFCRGESCSNVEIKRFKTQPTAPKAVGDAMVYSKNETSISIRWKAPFPPTGILKDYAIRYYEDSKPNDAKTEMVANMTCALWPDYNCLELTHLKKKKSYTITIHARNENPSSYSLPVKLKTVTKIEASEAPYDLKYKWTMNNDLELEWKHPNKSNGKILNFVIKIPELHYINITNVTQCKLTYPYKIENIFKPTTRYSIKIYANNTYEGEEDGINVISPPALPALSNKPKFQSTNTSITVEVSVEQLEGKTDSYRLILLVNQDSRKQITVYNCSVSKFGNKYSITIGSEYEQENQNCDKNNTENLPLNPGSAYSVTILLTNTFGNITRENVTTYLLYTTGEKPETSKPNLLPLLCLFLLLVPISAIIFWKKELLMKLITNITSETSQEDQILLSGLQDSYPEKEKIYSKPIQVAQFDDYVKESIENGELEKQHSIFPHGQTKPWTCGSMIENKTKNRYNNLIAYDHSRVILEQINGDPNSDYINANYIDGYQLQKAYIATQGPKAATLDDFWRMIWQENVQYIVMLANIYEGGKKNVEKYWPAPNATLQFENVAVTHVSSKMHENYEHRIFNINRHNVTRKLEQLHFLAWPDHGVPLYCQSLVPLLQKMLELPLTPKSPIVVHCSAGVGRTGTILLSHISLKMAQVEGYVDVLANLQNLREQRANLVDNAEQYKLAHLVILECLSGVKTAIQCSEIDNSVLQILENDCVKAQMKQLKDTQWRDEVMKRIGQKGKSIVVVKEKNRFQDIIPEIQGRISLNCFSDHESYINAITVDGFRRPARYIVTQQPLPNTLRDFWQLVEENDVATIISLNEINRDDVTSCDFWPSSANPQLELEDNITLSHTNTLSLACYDLITIQLNGKMTIEILAMKNWPAGTNCPKSTAQFLAFWEDSDAASKRSEKVIVTCYDGAKASGLYVATSFIIENIKLEQVCDVYQAVRTVKHNRSQFVQEEEQFKFLYKAAVDYVNGFQSYSDLI